MDTNRHEGRTGWPWRFYSCRFASTRGWLILWFVIAGVGVAAEAPLVSNPPASENRLTMLSEGYEALLARIHFIRAAKQSIAVQTFIWTDDESGRLIMYELIEAARRGVKVRIIADHLFSDQVPDTVAFLATVNPNLEIKHYRPTLSRLKPSMVHTMAASLRSFHGINQRMHSKIMLFDEEVLITGGRNIENSYFNLSTELNFRDRDVLAIGPLARDAAREFELFWNYRHSVASRDLIDVAAAMAKGSFRRYETRDDFDFGPGLGALDRNAAEVGEAGARVRARLKPVKRAAFISDEPGKKRGFFFGQAARITRELTSALKEARSSVVIQTPYLVLSNPARELFRDMQRRHPGLRIKVSSNSFASTDNIMAYSANYRLRNRYVQDLNLLVHEFKPEPAVMAELFSQRAEMVERARPLVAAGEQKRMPYLCIHAKSLVVDDRIAYIGSYNLDPRSENLNTEVGLLIEDEAFARELRAEIDRDMRPENSWVIARRTMPLGLETVNRLVGDILSLNPIDVWPIQNTSSFDLRPGAEPLEADHPKFHANYREVGAFPGTEGLFTTKEIMTRIYKAVGAPLTPIL